MTTTATTKEEKLEDNMSEKEEKEMDDPNAMSAQEQLFYFARRGKVDEIKKIARSADVNAVDNLGSKHSPYISRNTALHYAVESGSLECVQVLYNLEAKLDATNKLQCTPLHVAASLGYTEIVKFLLSVQADIEAKNIVSNTPLHCAVYAGHTETVKLMLGQFDEPIDALLEPNGVGMGAAKYTAHEDMKTLLRTYFPKRNSDKGQGNNAVEEEAGPSEVDNEE